MQEEYGIVAFFGNLFEPLYFLDYVIYTLPMHHDVITYGYIIHKNKWNDRFEQEREWGLMYATDTCRLDHLFDDQRVYNLDYYLLESNYDENKVEDSLDWLKNTERHLGFWACTFFHERVGGVKSILIRLHPSRWRR